MRESIHSKIKAARATVARDWEAGIVQISMMGFQAQAVVGSMVGLIQAVYLVQFGARATILSDYLVLALPIKFATSCLAVTVLVGVSLRHSWSLFVTGCLTSLAASLALTFPPWLYSDVDEQASFLSHYFGILFIIANAGAKLRDYPTGLAKVYLLEDTQARASENAYNKIFDVMIGNGVNGALMLSLLADPSPGVKVCLGSLQIISTVVSLRGAPLLLQLRDPAATATRAPAEVLGARVEDLQGVVQSSFGCQGVAEPASFSSRGSRALWELTKVTLNVHVWQLMIIEWCAGFIFTLNNQAAGTIYWSSIVGVDDSMRSVFIALESALGGGVIGFVTTLYVTRLYHRQANASVIIPRIVAGGATLGSLLLVLFGTTSLGALCGITSLYLYYFIYAWSNIEFLNLLDSLRATHLNENPLLYMFLVKDIAGGVLGSMRDLVLMWMLASTGFYEPDCNARCANTTKSDCVSQCHAESHASIGGATVALVWTLYAVVTPGAYLLACAMMRNYTVRDTRELGVAQ